MRRLVLTGYVAHRPGLNGNYKSGHSVSQKDFVVKANIAINARRIVPDAACRWHGGRMSHQLAVVFSRRNSILSIHEMVDSSCIRPRAIFWFLSEMLDNHRYPTTSHERISKREINQGKGSPQRCQTPRLHTKAAASRCDEWRITPSTSDSANRPSSSFKSVMSACLPL